MQHRSPKQPSGSLSASESKQLAINHNIDYNNIMCFTSGLLTINDLPQVIRAVLDARDEWYYIGLELKIDAGSLNAIRNDNRHSVQDCLLALLQKWLNNDEPKPTWGALKEALKSPLVNKAQLIAKFPCD